VIHIRCQAIENSNVPKLGPPESYFHCIWFAANEDEPIEWYDELDASRCSIRCIRRYRDDRLEAFSYATDDWRDKMPEGSLPTVEVINQNPEFAATEISKDEFEVIWRQATSGSRHVTYR
jgi:hypothetical protein